MFVPIAPDWVGYECHSYGKIKERHSREQHAQEQQQVHMHAVKRTRKRIEAKSIVIEDGDRMTQLNLKIAQKYSTEVYVDCIALFKPYL